MIASAIIARLRTYSGPLKETVWISAGQIFAFVGGVVGIKILTNLMPPERYGEFSLGISLAGIINMIVFGALSQIVLRYYSVCQQRGELGAYVRVLMVLHEQAGLMLLILGAACAAIVAFVLDWHWALLVLLASVFGVMSGVQGSLMSLLNAVRDRRSSAQAQGLDTWLRLGFAVVLVLVLGTQGCWALLGYILGSGCVLLMQFKSLRTRNMNDTASARDDAQEVALRSEFMSYGVPFFAFAGLGAVSQFADRWLLQTFSGSDSVGIYTAMFQIASAPVLFLMAVATQLVIPVVFSRFGSLDNPNGTSRGKILLSRSVITVGAMYLVITFIAYAVGQPLIALLTNAEYARHANIFWVLVLSLALFNLAQLMSVSGLGLNQPRAYCVPKFAQAASLVVFGSLFIRLWNVDGMAYALLLSSMLYLLWIAVVNISLWKKHGRLENA